MFSLALQEKSSFMSQLLVLRWVSSVPFLDLFSSSFLSIYISQELNYNFATTYFMSRCLDNHQATKLIACKSDPAKLPKS